MSESPLSTIAEINPPLPRHVNDSELVSFVGMSDVKESGGITSSRDVSFEAVKIGFTRFVEGDVLFAKITPCMENGKGALAAGLTNGLGCGSTEFHVLRAKGENCSGFIYQVVQSVEFRQKAEMNMSGSAGQQRVPSNFFKEYSVHIPEPPQQRRIAEILSTLDEAIEQTEALIAKMQQVKAGLMHDLFTRGVTPDGHLRSTREQTPELYKESPLGWIPKEWEVATLNSLTTRITDGSHQSVKRESGDNTDIPFIFVSCIKDGIVLWENSASVSLKTYNSISRGREPHPGMILYTVVGSIGNVAMLHGDQRVAFERNIACVSINSTANPLFISNWLRSSVIQRHAESVAVGNAQKLISLGKLKQFPVLLPSVGEQQQIAMRESNLDSRIRMESNLLLKLRYQKHGLMHDLLSGQARIKD